MSIHEDLLNADYLYSYQRFMFVRLACFFILFLTAQTRVLCQKTSPLFKNFTQGLASTEVYDIYQDAHGKMWFATDRGLTVYNGKTFRDVPTYKAIQTNAIFGIKAESDQKVWIITKRKEIFEFNPLTSPFLLKPYRHNTVLSKEISTHYYDDLHINHINFSNDTLTATFLHPYRLTILPSGQVDSSCFYKSINGDMYKCGISIVDDKKHPYSKLGEPITDQNKIVFEHLDGKKEVIIPNHQYAITRKMSSVACYKIDEKNSYYALGRYVVKKDSNGGLKVVSLGSEILDFEVSNSAIIVGTFTGAYELDTSLSILGHYLENEVISAIERDNKNGYWFATLGNGVYYSQNLHMKVVKGTEQMLPKCVIIKNNNIITNDNNLQLHIIRAEGNLIINGVAQLGKVFRYKNRSLEPLLGESFFDSTASLYTYFPEKEGVSITGYGRYVRIFKSNYCYPRKFDSIQSILSFLQLTDSTALLGTKKNLLVYGPEDKCVEQKIKNYSGDLEIRDILQIKGKFIYLIVDGLLVEDELSTIKLTENNGLQNSYITGVLQIDESSFWAYGNNGVDKVEFTSKGFKINPLREFEDLPSGEINDMFITENHIYFATKGGICILPKNSLSQAPVLDKNAFQIDSVATELGITEFTDTIILKPYNNGITYYFNYLQFDNREIKIEYQLEKDREWLLSNGNSIHLSRIDFGCHKILLRARYKNKTIPLMQGYIFVPTPLMERAWFYPVILCIIFIIAYFLLRKTLIRRQKKEQEKTKLEMSLLSSRMNPHFTFNTISSIQSYILKNEKAPAIQYLSDFGLLMRKSLDYSYKDYINISEELDFLKLLVTLENKRFDADFHLKIIRKDKGRDFKIPAMLIQPMVENVILHCVFPAGAEKVIYIEIDETDQHHIIIIEDFGMNLESKNKKNHESHGLSIVRDRLKLHNGKHFSEDDFTLLNKTEPGQHGYKVTLKLLRK